MTVYIMTAEGWAIMRGTGLPEATNDTVSPTTTIEFASPTGAYRGEEEQQFKANRQLFIAEQKEEAVQYAILSRRGWDIAIRSSNSTHPMCRYFPRSPFGGATAASPFATPTFDIQVDDLHDGLDEAAYEDEELHRMGTETFFHSIYDVGDIADEDRTCINTGVELDALFEEDDQ